MVKVPFPCRNTYTSAIWKQQKQQFRARKRTKAGGGTGANRPSQRQTHADASHRRRQPCRRTSGQRPTPGQHQDDHHGHQQRDEGVLLWCNLAAETRFQPPGRTRKEKLNLYGRLQDKSSPRAPTGTCTKVRNLGRTPCGRNKTCRRAVLNLVGSYPPVINLAHDTCMGHRLYLYSVHTAVHVLVPRYMPR